MRQKANYFKLGLFVIAAIVAGIAVLIIIGTGRWLERRITIETYFKESVQGLDVGSKLKYRGVTIGEVTKISFTYTSLPARSADRPSAIATCWCTPSCSRGSSAVAPPPAT